MSSDENAAEKLCEEKREKLTLEKIIRRPKFTQTEEMRKWVNEIYARELGSYTVLLLKICPLRNRSIRIDIEKKEVSIVDMGTCNKFLDCFAPSITKLRIEYSESADELKHRAQFDRIVNKYCAEHIVELKIVRASKVAMMKMKKPFAKVEVIVFEDCFIGGQLADFNYCFPKMKKLTIYDRFAGEFKRYNGNCIAKHFPNLEYMRFDMSGYDILRERFVERSFQNKHVTAALQLNPQLQTLKTGYGFTSKFFKEVSKYLQRIENLEIESSFYDLDNSTIHLKNVKKLVISCFKLKKIPLTFDQLEEFSLQYCQNAFEQNDIMEFILKNPTITKLQITPSLSSFFVMSDETKVKLAKGLPSLTDVNLGFPCDDLIFLTECKLLKKIQFHLDGREKYETLLQRIGPHWKATAGKSEGFFAAPNVLLERQFD